MLYDSYKLKMQKLARVWQWIKKFRVPIIAVFCILFASLGTFLGIKGNITKNVSLSADGIVYGDSYDIVEAEALLSSVKGYEFRKDGESEWGGEKPTAPGKYYVRALTRGGFGTRRGKPVEFSIFPRPVEIRVADEKIRYGDRPTNIEAPLIGKDKINTESLSFAFDDLTSFSTQVSVTVGSIKVTDEKGSDISDYYTFTAKKSDIEFTARKINTIRPRSASAVYNAQEQTYELLPDDATAAELPYGARIVFDIDILQKNFGRSNLFSASRAVVQNPVNAGEYTLRPRAGSVKIYAENSFGAEVDILNEVGLCFISDTETALKDGSFTIERRPLEIKTFGGEWTYDGQSHGTAEQIESSHGLIGGHKAVFAGSHINTVTHTWDTCSNEYFAEDFAVENENGFTSDESGFAYADNYDISVVSGLMKINPKKITVTTASGKKMYDGSPLSAKSLIDSSAGGVYGHSAVIKASAGTVTLTDSGEILNTYSAGDIEVRNAYGYDVTRDFSIEVESGILTVSRRSAAVTVRNTEKRYDGTDEHTLNVETNGFIANEIPLFGGTFTGGVRPVNTGVYTVVSASPKSGNPFFKAGNYDIRYIVENSVTLTVLGSPLDIYTAGGSHVYDGKPYSPERKYAYFQGNLISSHEIRPIEITEITDCSQSGAANVVKYGVFDISSDADVTYNYELYVHNVGRLVITPKSITVMTASGEWIYDGKPHSKKELEDSAIVGMEGYAAEIATSRVVSLTNADSILNVYYGYEIAVKKDGADLTHNFDIHIINGTLTVKKRDITVFTGSARKVYDGDSLKNRETGIAESSPYKLVDGHSLYILPSSPEVSIINAGSMKNTYAVGVGGGSDTFTDNYRISYEYGELTIDKRSVKIHAETVGGIVYDGGPHSHRTDEWEYSADTAYRFVGTEKPYVSWSYGDNIPVDAGTYRPSGMKVSDYYECGFYSDNYTVTAGEHGTLTIVPRKVFVTLSGSKTYDAKPIDACMWEYGGVSAIDESYRFVGAHTPGFSFGELKDNTDAGEYSFLGAEVLDNDDFKKKNYTVIIDGKYNVTPRPVAVKAKDKRGIVYDGNLHEYGALDYDIVSGNFIGEERPYLSWKYYTSGNYETEPKDARTYTVSPTAVIGGTGGFKERNYDVSFAYGTLVIDEREITIRAIHENNIHYDGNSHAAGELDYEIVNGSFAANEILHVHFYYIRKSDNDSDNPPIVEPINAGVYVTYRYGKREGVGGFKAINYNVHLLESELIILPREVYIELSGAKTYDGMPLQNGDLGAWKYAIISAADTEKYGFVNGQSPEFSLVRLSGNVDAGEYSFLRVSAAANGDFLPENYNLHILGNYTISRREATVKAAEHIGVIYDGNVHLQGKTSYYIVSGSFAGTERPYIVWEYLGRSYGNTEMRNADTYDISFAGTDGGEGGFKISNYDLTVNGGTFMISPRPVAVYITAEKQYDGTEEIKEITGVHPDGALPDNKFISDDVPAIQAEFECGYSSVGEHRNVGVYNISVVNYARLNAEFTNYEITWLGGVLSVNKRVVKIRSVSKTSGIIYDGMSHEYGEYDYTVTEGSFAGEERPRVTWGYFGRYHCGIVSTPVDADNYDVWIKEYYDGTGGFLRSNYDIGCYSGILEISPREVYIELSGGKTYDGSPLQNGDLGAWKYCDISAANPEKHGFVGAQEPVFSLAALSENVNAGEYSFEKAVSAEDNGGFISANYSVNVFGKYEIARRAVTVKAENKTLGIIYDGNNHAYGALDYELVEGSLDFAGVEKPYISWTYYGHNADEFFLNVPITAADTYTVYFARVTGGEKGFEISNYDLTVSDGMLIISPRSVAVYVTAEKLYDGTEDIEEITSIYPDGISDGNKFIADDESGIQAAFAYDYTSAGEHKNVGKYGVAVANRDALTAELTNYDIIWLGGEITVNKRPVYVRPSGSKVYNGTAEYEIDFIYEGLSAPEGSEFRFVFGEMPEFIHTFDGSADAGTYEVYGSVRSTETCDVKNYDIYVSIGNFVIEKRVIEFSSVTDGKIYDALPINTGDVVCASGTENSGLLENIGHYFVISDRASIVAVSDTHDNNNKFTVAIFDSYGNNVTKNYGVAAHYGTLTVTKRPIIIESHGNSDFIYDGEEHSEKGFSEIPFAGKNGGLISNHVIKVVGFTTVRDAAQIPNTLTYAITAGEGGDDVTENYEIDSSRRGMLVVSPREIKMIPQSGIKYYDGTETYNVSADVVGEYDFVAGEKPNFIGVYGASPIDVGTYYFVGIEAADSNPDFKPSNYSIVYIDGGTSLTVIKRPIALKVSASSANFTYAHSALPQSFYSVSSEFIGRWDVQGASAFGIVLSEISSVSFKYVFRNVATGETFGADEVLHAGEYLIFVESIVSGEFENYEFDEADITSAAVTVLPRAVSIRLRGGERLYNGTATLYSDIPGGGFDVVGGTVFGGDVLCDVKEFVKYAVFDGLVYNTDGSVLYSVSGASSVTDAARYNVTVCNLPSDFFNADYNVTALGNTYTVKKLKMTVRNTSDKFVYDGEDRIYRDIIDWSGASMDEEVRGIVESLKHELVPAAEFAVRSAGVHRNMNSVSVRSADGVDISYNYDITVEAGIIEVERAEITVSVAPQEFIYSGAAIAPAYAAVLPGDQSLTVYSWRFANGKMIHAGSYGEYEIDSYEVFDSLGAVRRTEHGETFYYKNNYKFAYDIGTLTVSPRAVTVRPLGGKVYDGTFGIESGDIVNIYPDSAVSENMFVNGETPALEYEYVVFDNCDTGDHGIRVTDASKVAAERNNDYSIIWEDGLLTVSPREVWVYLYGEKVYDGRPADNVTFEYAPNSWHASNRFVAGQSPSFSYDSLSGYVDAGRHILSGVAAEDSGDFKLVNYNLHIENSLYVITPRPVYIYTGDASKPYDGTPLSSDGFTCEPESEGRGLINGHKAQADAITKITNVHETEERNNRIYVKIFDGEKDVSANYETDNTTYAGKLEITPLSVAVCATGLQKIYDGKNDAEIAFTVESGNWVKGEEPKLLWSYGGNAIQPKNAGEYVIEYRSAEDNGSFKAGNYAVSQYKISNMPKLIIERREVKIAPKNTEKVFDGTENCIISYNEISDMKFVDGEIPKIVWSLSPSPSVMPGEYTVSFVRTEDSGTYLADNYVVGCESTSVLTVHNKIGLTPLFNISRTYDGTDKISVGGEISGNVCDGRNGIIGSTIDGFTFKGAVKEIRFISNGGAVVASVRDAGAYRVYYSDISLSMSVEGFEGELPSLEITSDTEGGYYYVDFVVSERKVYVAPTPEQIDYEIGRNEYFLGENPGASAKTEAYIFDSSLAAGHRFVINATESFAPSGSGASVGIADYDIFDANGISVKHNYDAVISARSGEPYAERAFKARMSFNKVELNVICSASSAVATEKFYYVYDEYGEYKVVAPSLDGCLSIKGGDAGASLIRAVGGRLSAYIQLPSAVGENRKTRVYASVYDGLGNDISGVFKIVYDGDKDVFINVDKALVEITSVGDEITNVKFNGAVAEISPDGYYALGAYHKLKAELIRGEAFICRISNGEERAINATLKSRYDIRINGVQAG